MSKFKPGDTVYYEDKWAPNGRKEGVVVEHPNPPEWATPDIVWSYWGRDDEGKFPPTYMPEDSLTLLEAAPGDEVWQTVTEEEQETLRRLGVHFQTRTVVVHEIRLIDKEA